jgi:delta-aminolevulinic acid dehydratase/porphobilinogen synthase
MNRALAMIKSKYPEAIVCTDIALDPYSDQVTLHFLTINYFQRFI